MAFSHVRQYRETASSGCDSHIILLVTRLTPVAPERSRSSIVRWSATFFGRLLTPRRSWYISLHSGQRKKLPSVTSISAHPWQMVWPQPGSSRGFLNNSKQTGQSILWYRSVSQKDLMRSFELPRSTLWGNSTRTAWKQCHQHGIKFNCKSMIWRVEFFKRMSQTEWTVLNLQQEHDFKFKA